MITTLAIKNYALIEDVRVDLQEGLTIITGETGAGKSILLGALALILGRRADVGSVRVASKKCIIECEFSIKNYGLQDMFLKNDLDYDNHTIIRREILPSGKSRAFVNDTPVSLAQLQKLGTHLVDIHSQHETLSLSSENFQIEIIDVLAGNESLLETYSEKLEEVRTISETIKNLKLDKERVAKELDYNTFLCSELVDANVGEMIQKELEETFETLNNAEIIQESFSQIIQVFSAEQIGTLETAKEARIVLGKIKGFSSKYEHFWDRLNSTIIELEDVFDGIEDLGTSLEANPSKLLEINEKLQTLYKLQQKHGVATVTELIEIQEDLESKIESVGDIDEKLEHLDKERTTFRTHVMKTGALIHKQRQKAIPILKKQLEAYLAELGLPNARFKFELVASENFRKNGTIDTGVSGEIANQMARIMGEMSTSTQLLSITHLPQIAAKGEYHIKVYKEDVNEVTRTRLKGLNEDERIVEIAQMIGGNTLTDAALANAKELLN